MSSAVNPPAYPSKSSELYKQFLEAKTRELEETVVSAFVVELSADGKNNPLKTVFADGPAKYIIYDNKVVNDTITTVVPRILDGNLVFEVKDGFLFDRTMPLIGDYIETFSSVLEPNVNVSWIVEIRKTRIRKPVPENSCKICIPAK